jgi:hypothetical protein
LKDQKLVEEWFMDTLGSSVDVIIAGEIFGGRRGELPQVVKELEFGYDKFVIKFGTTEILSIYRPEKIKIGKQKQLIVESASKAIFGWHHYGVAQSDETWSEITYLKSNKKVQVVWTGVITDRRVIDYPGDKFVELI